MFLIAQLVKNLPAMQKTPVRFLGWEDPLEKDRLPTPVFLGVPCGSAGKESACNSGHLGSIPGLGRSPGEGKGYPLQYSGLSMDHMVHGVTKSQTWLSNFHLSTKIISLSKADFLFLSFLLDLIIGIPLSGKAGLPSPFVCLVDYLFLLVWNHNYILFFGL